MNPAVTSASSAERNVCVESLESRRMFASVPAGFSDAKVTSGISQASGMALAPDGRIFVLEQAGEVRIIEHGKLLPKPFVTVSTVLKNTEGLIGITLDPDFSTNHFVYLCYTKTSPKLHDVISRFTADGDVAVAHSEKILFSSDTLISDQHHCGGMKFGPDGKLYFTWGDDTVKSNAQSLKSLEGKVLRINKDGSIPSSNPFYKKTAGNDRAIYAIGLRSPFSLAISPTTGQIITGDVGTTHYEELDNIKAGGNYGWPDTEGPKVKSGETSPLLSYANSLGACVIGGDFYVPRTDSFPGSYVGKYFFADYTKGWLKYIDPTAKNPVVHSFATGLNQVVAMNVAADGSIYYLENGSGQLRRITFPAR